MTRRTCDGPTLLLAFRSAVANLALHVEEINALNVFPVPDGDTGSNLLATVRAALAEAEALPAERRTLSDVAEALSFGALMGARGNSGVILSQVLRGMADAAEGKQLADGRDLALALARGAQTAYAAVAKPVEGTILTVSREAAEAAAAEGQRNPHVETVLAAAVSGAERSVARTPSLLPILREAGVVDAGGQGLYRLMQGLLLSLAEREADERVAAVGAPPAVTVIDGEAAFGYETVYLVTAGEAPLDLVGIRSHLETMGESVLVAGDARTVKVHVHNHRPDEVIAYGLSLGTLSRITVENLDLQSHEALHGAEALPAHGAAQRASVHATVDLDAGLSILGLASADPADVPAAERLPETAHADLAPLGVVAVASGEGLARTFASFGVATVVEGGQSSNPSAGELAAAIRSTRASDVIVLPNNPNVRLAAEQAGLLTPEVRVTVVPTRNAPEGLAALLAIDLGESGPENSRRMLAAARAIQTLQVTRAVRDATIGGRRVRRGQTIVLDPDEGLMAAGQDRVRATLAGLSRLRPGFELVTIYSGADAGPAEAERLVRRVREGFADVQVELIAGGQPHYAYLISAE